MRAAGKKTDPQYAKPCDCGHRKNVHLGEFATGACQSMGCQCQEFHFQLSFGGHATSSGAMIKGATAGKIFKSWSQKMPNGGRA